MPVPSLLTDLSTTAASNSPSGSDNVFPDLDNYIRALSAFVSSVATNSATNGFTQPYLPAANPTYTGTLTGGTGVVNLGSGQFYKDASGNVGIATATPGARLEVAGSGSATEVRLRSTDTTPANLRAYVNAVEVGKISFLTGNNLSFETGGTERMRLDASGNLGVGVTSPVVRLDVNGAARIRAASQLQFFNADNTSGASIQNSGTTATDALTFNTTATERMRIDANGNVLVGTTTASAKLYVSGVAATGLTARFDSTNNNTIPVFQLITADTTGDSRWQEFYSNGSTLRGSIDYNRAGGLVRYNTTSDYRAKDIFGPVQNPGAAIDALKVYEGQMKGATQSRPMLVAHEAQAVAPYAVTGTKDAGDADGQPVYQQIDTSSLVPLLLAELQTLRARVAALEAA